MRSMYLNVLPLHKCPSHIWVHLATRNVTCIYHVIRFTNCVTADARSHVACGVDYCIQIIRKRNLEEISDCL
jgi:hypothetical protein